MIELNNTSNQWKYLDCSEQFCDSKSVSHLKLKLIPFAQKIV